MSDRSCELEESAKSRMSERYAIYFAPDPLAPIWELASSWLGRDARERAPCAQIVPGGFSPKLFQELTAPARRYGFHATLKPPMRLAPGHSREDLLEGARLFAQHQAPVALGAMQVTALSDFVAIVPSTEPDALSSFASLCVTHFEPWRAPLTVTEREKRLAPYLSPRQIELLDKFGYPYVMDEFRFHLTLSGRLSDEHRPAFLDAARAHFADALAVAMKLDRISIYHEPEPGAPFLRIADLPLTGQRSPHS